jgi:hypothetical protein
VAERLARVPPERLVRRPGRGWSIQEHAGRLADLDEALFLPRLDEYALGVTTLRPADMTNKRTEAANHNARPLNEVIQRLRDTRNLIMTQLEALHPDAFSQVAVHPRLGVPMRLVDMIYFHAEHDDYHLASIGELLRAGTLTMCSGAPDGSS